MRNKSVERCEKMGFRNGSYATVWDIKTVSDYNTQIRISIDRKNKQTGEYEQDFSGFVSCLGSAVASKAASLKERQRIKLGNVAVSTFYNKEKGVTYYNFKVFDFEVQKKNKQEKISSEEAVQDEIDDGEIENDDRLPF